MQKKAEIKNIEIFSSEKNSGFNDLMMQNFS